MHTVNIQFKFKLNTYQLFYQPALACSFIIHKFYHINYCIPIRYIWQLQSDIFEIFNPTHLEFSIRHIWHFQSDTFGIFNPTYYSSTLIILYSTVPTISKITPNSRESVVKTVLLPSEGIKIPPRIKNILIMRVYMPIILYTALFTLSTSCQYHISISTVNSCKFFMSSFLYNPPFIKYQNFISLLYCI